MDGAASGGGVRSPRGSSMVCDRIGVWSWGLDMTRWPRLCASMKELAGVTAMQGFLDDDQERSEGVGWGVHLLIWLTWQTSEWAGESTYDALSRRYMGLAILGE